MDITTQSRPKVLLLGNGLNRSFEKGSWEKLLKDISTRSFENEKLKSPMTLRAIYVTYNHVDEALKTHQSGFYGDLEPNSELREMLTRLLSMGFDCILTTNYSYELEEAALGKKEVTKQQLKKLSQNLIPGEKVEPKYMLQSYNCVSVQGVENRIFHIHGEARKPQSMILSHYAYGKLLTKIMDYIDNREKSYLRLSQYNRPLEIRSWVDMFLFGDVYILGFGMDYAEFDLWWLLDRKRREKGNTGTVHFWPGNPDAEKEGIMKLFDVQVHPHCLKSDGTADYKELYNTALKELMRLTSGKEIAYV